MQTEGRRSSASACLLRCFDLINLYLRETRRRSELGGRGRYVAHLVGRLFGLYLLLAAKLTGAGSRCGGYGGGLAATGTTVDRQAGNLRFRFAAGVALAVRLGFPGDVIVECGIVGLALWRQLVERRQVEGTFRIVPFDPGGDDPMSGRAASARHSGRFPGRQHLCRGYRSRAGPSSGSSTRPLPGTARRW